MNDPIGGAGGWRPVALERPDVSAYAPVDEARAQASPDRWLGELAADGGPIVGAPAFARGGDVEASAARILSLLGQP